MTYAFLTPGEYRRIYGHMLWRYQKRGEKMKRENYHRWAKFVLVDEVCEQQRKAA